MSGQKKGKKAVQVEVEKVCKSFSGVEVLHDINLTVKPREIFVIMGPSGSGKSVLLRSIIGLETPTEGQVLIDGNDAAFRRTHHKIVTSMVFQAGALFNSMTVFENLALYSQEHGLYNKKTIKDKVMHTLSILRLENAAYKNPSELSGGMRKRVAIARSLMMEPQLLLYDEPTSELDPVTSANIIEIIATLKEEFDVTSIVVSHDRDLAYGIADRVAVLINGKLLTIDTVPNIKKCTDPAVKDFFSPKIDPTKPRFRQNSNHSL